MRIDFPNIEGSIEIYMDVMRAMCGETKGKSMIDLMCCTAPNTPKLGFTNTYYVDVVPRQLDHAQEQKFFIQYDVLKLGMSSSYNFFPMALFDVSICSDGIEHLTQEDGCKLIAIMEQRSIKQILFTPTTDLFGMAQDHDHDPEAHRSLWKPDDFEDYASIVFPHYHKVWNGGAFFFFKTPSLKYDFDRVVAELKTKPWSNF